MLMLKRNDPLEVYFGNRDILPPINFRTSDNNVALIHVCSQTAIGIGLYQCELGLTVVN